MVATVTQRGLVPFHEACSQLHMHPNTGYALVKEGRFPVEVLPIGYRKFCRQTDLDRFIMGDNYDGNAAKRAYADGMTPCEVCNRWFKSLPIHTRAMHPELVAHDGA